jgi:translation initiation factor eIF-2B subunit delta
MDEIMNKEELVREIKEDTSSGASEIMRKTAESLLFMSNRLVVGNSEEYVSTMIEFGRELVLAQPAMAPVFNAVNTVILEIESGISENSSTMELNQRVDSAAKEISSASHKALARIQKEVVEVIGNGQTILTHSYSSTVISSLLQAKNEGKDFGVVVTESRPLFEGRRTADILSGEGIRTTLIADFASFQILDDVDMIITGCDSICENGIVNKIGTRGLAIAASQLGIPFYLLGEKSKILPSGYLKEPVIDDREPNEILENASGIAVKNMYFDITPHRFFSGLITEDGMVSMEEIPTMLSAVVVSTTLLKGLR